MASARTSDHHPIPIQATRSGSALITLPSPRTSPTSRLCTPRVDRLVSVPAMSFPIRADRLDGQLGDPQIGLPVTAAHADAADAFTVDQHRHAAFHGRPPFRSGGKRKSDRMADVEVLTGRAFGRGRTPV